MKFVVKPIRIKSRSFIVLNLLVLVLVLAVLIGAGGGTKPDEIVLDKTQPRPVSAPPSPPEDAFAVFITGNWMGRMEPCGCSDMQLGGIDRRTHLLKAVPDNRRLLLEAGPVLAKQNRQQQLKLEAFLFSLKYLGYDAVGLTPYEIDVTRNQLNMAADKRPPLVVTNMDESNRRTYRAVDVVKKNMCVNGRTLEAVVLAVAQPEESGISAAMPLEPPFGAIEKMVKEYGTEEDGRRKLVIAMLSAFNSELTAKLSEIKEVDIVVTVGTADEPEWCNEKTPQERPMLVTAGKMGKYILRLDVQLPEDNGPKKITFHRVPVEDEFRQDPNIVKLLDDYQFQVELEDMINNPQANPRLALDDDNTFVGNATCGVQCHDHEDIFERWSEFKHAKAIETLEEVNRQFDPECVVCHVIGMEYEGGYQSMEKTPDLADVGCEMCHGPGKKHCDEPEAPYKVQFTTCEKCHDHENSPNFDIQCEQYFEKIKHWEGGLKYWRTPCPGVQREPENQSK
ncbi:MAG: hypothetical protein JW709_02860 [Sedimentisphaerales bacterium]|nr:hypothetical protein [Sedimentisphaerales bacterium]